MTGVLSERLYTPFEPMTVRIDGGTTTMTVEVQDQAALFGVVDRVADLGLELVGVSRSIEPAPTTPAP